ncbi:EAL domain-containing protein [Blastomonas aquatica]
MRKPTVSRPSILIIDDDEDICKELISALGSLGFACSCRAGLDPQLPINQINADIVLLDLSMPNKDGFQVIEALARAEQPPQLIVASGREDRIIRAAVRSAQVAGLDVLGSLSKPYSIASLVALVERHHVKLARVIDRHEDLLHALAEDDGLERNLRTAFQSKRRLSSGVITGYEALLRLSVQGQAINPELIFTPSADLSLQMRITHAVVNHAARFASMLTEQGTPVPVAVNCTPAILCSPDFLGMITDALERWQLPPSMLMVEITEHETVHSFEAMTAAASRLALRHIGIAIDDYGRGTTSLERLFDLPVSEVKIDKEIFWRCIDGSAPLSLLKEVTSYCRDRGIVSTIEGVETRSHLKHALAVGADYGQGFLWDCPTVFD